MLEVSHMGFVTALLDTLHVDAAARPRLLELLRDKNAHELHAASSIAQFILQALQFQQGVLLSFALALAAGGGQRGAKGAVQA